MHSCLIRPPHRTNATHLATRSLYVHQTLAECPSQTVSHTSSTTRFTGLPSRPTVIVIAGDRYQSKARRPTKDSVHSTRDESLLLCLHTAAWTPLLITQFGCIEVVHHPVQ